MVAEGFSPLSQYPEAMGRFEGWLMGRCEVLNRSAEGSLSSRSRLSGSLRKYEIDTCRAGSLQSLRY